MGTDPARSSAIPRFSRLPVPASRATTSAAPDTTSSALPSRLAVPKVRQRPTTPQTASGRTGTAVTSSRLTPQPGPARRQPSFGGVALGSSPPDDAVPTSSTTSPGRLPYQAGGTVGAVRRSRPSLSDRTVETLSRLPSSPAASGGRVRRASAFFVPMDGLVNTPSRPASRAGGQRLGPSPLPASPGARPATLRARPSLSRFGGTVNGTPTNRPASRAAVGPKTLHPRLPSKRTGATPMPRPSLADLFSPPGSGTTAVTAEPESPSGMVMVSSKSDGTPTRARVEVRPLSPERTPSRSPVRMSPSARARVPNRTVLAPFLVVKPEPVLDHPARAAPPPVPRLTAMSDRRSNVPSKSRAEPGTGKTGRPERTLASSKSSTSFRQQIRQARAAHKAVESDPKAAKVGPRADPFGTADHYDAIADPFNQLKVGPERTIPNRISAGRTTGRLVLAGLGLKSVPTELIEMFDPAGKDNQTVEWSSIVDLVRLDLSDNEITDLGDELFPDVPTPEATPSFWDPAPACSETDAAFSPVHMIESLNVMDNQLSRLPVGLRQLRHLTTVNVAKNNLGPAAVAVLAELVGLRDLRLSGNKLGDRLPDQVCRISTLETLEARDCHLTEVPAEIENLSRLRLLDLAGNRLEKVPMGSLGRLAHLTDLNLSRNRLAGCLIDKTDDDRADTTMFRSLAILDVSANRLSSIMSACSPEPVLPMRAITSLAVSMNNLTALPSLVCSRKLVTILAADNSITTVPTGFFELPVLRTVNLANNSLRELAVTTEDVVRLGRMESLMAIDLVGNPVRDRRLVGMSTDKIRARMKAMVDLADTVESIKPATYTKPPLSSPSRPSGW